MGGGLTKAAIAMVDDDPALTAVIREALPQTVALLQPGGAAAGLSTAEIKSNCAKPDKWRFY